MGLPARGPPRRRAAERADRRSPTPRPLARLLTPGRPPWTVDYSFLQTLWFVLIAVLWIGYFVLEGFDFGVGMLLRRVGHDDGERRAIIHTIGPVWDGNEVWLLTAGGATFAAFPEWYATLFSGFYLALFLDPRRAHRPRRLLRVLGQGRPAARGARRGSGRSVIGSFLAALLWGVAWANIVRGVPIDAEASSPATSSRCSTPTRCSAA